MDFYNHTRRLFAAEAIDLANLKVMLVNNHTFDAAHTNISSVVADEVSGSGWAEGGEAIANAAITTTGTNEATLNGDDIAVTATGGSIGPATALVVYQDVGTEEYPLFHHAFGGAEEAGEGTDFRVDWHENGIARWLEPAS
jgi:hypothetical protein